MREFTFDTKQFAYDEERRRILKGISFKEPSALILHCVGARPGLANQPSPVYYSAFFIVTGGSIQINNQDIRLAKEQKALHIGNRHSAARYCPF